MKFKNKTSELRIHNGNQEWYRNSRWHRLDHHRLDGPAFIYRDGSQYWHQNGLLHRLEGPAVIWPFNVQEWWENDIRVK